MCLHQTDVDNHHFTGVKTQPVQDIISHFSQLLNQMNLHCLHLPIPLELAMPLEFVKSQQGKANLKHEGNLYCLLRENDELKAWGCDKNSVKPLQQRLRTTFPKYKRLARSIRRQCGWANNPATLKDVAIPLEQQLTLRGEKFLASGFDDKDF